jgi:molecular chaperone GrpE
VASHKHHKENESSNFAQVAAARADESAANSSVGEPAASSGSDGSSTEKHSLPDELQKLLAEKQELLNTLIRRQADFENYRKRVEKERNQDRHRGIEHLIEQLLPVLDAFDRALAGDDSDVNAEYRKGFEMIRTQLWNALKKQGLERVESVGMPFDPHLHHAIESVENTAQPEGVIIGEMQPGYTFHGHVLRPAMVRVSAAASN